MEKPSDYFLTVARYTALELPFERYMNEDGSVRKIPKNLMYKAIDLWLYNEEYKVTNDDKALKILKSALMSEQTSRFAENLENFKNRKKRGRKSMYDKEFVFDFIENDYKDRLKKWNNLTDKENYSKPNLTISFKKAADLIKRNYGIKDVKIKSLQKAYERYCSEKVPFWFKYL